MLVASNILQQPTRASASNQGTSERPERPERPEPPERPEAHAGAQSKAELQEEIRQTIRAAQDAAQEAAREGANQAREGARKAREAANQVRIENGQLPARPDMGGAHTIEGGPFDQMIPPQVVDIAQGFFFMCAAMVIGWPLARAFGRRIERGGQTAVVAPAMTEQLQRIEQAVDSMSIEIERISESQRFLAKLQSAPQGEHAVLPGSDRR